MKYGQRIKLRCALNPSADFVEVHEEVIPLHAVHDASKEIIEGEVYQEYECGFSGCPQAMRHMSPPCRTLAGQGRRPVGALPAVPAAPVGRPRGALWVCAASQAAGRARGRGAAAQDVRAVSLIAGAAACGSAGGGPGCALLCVIAAGRRPVV
ncbi:hypothetical protein CYMTET_31131 [Cymbomonas tetramitiformis]|uniref:Uncharacterized protein n=1 Tax=Cymbomonas tetramitiformis TaxID=36881 RepID=A0AAE0FI49_9CHLO|nr:hypothetical protein CYMTET_31131 [Cymbomonas tetramitiformis]